MLLVHLPEGVGPVLIEVLIVAVLFLEAAGVRMNEG